MPTLERERSAGAASLSTIGLGWAFLKIGMTAFGGLGAALSLIERDLVERRRVLTPEQMAEALTFTKPLPGSTVVQVVSYVGYRLGGWTGSALATAAFVLPSAVVMVLLAGLFGAVRDFPGFASIMTGLVAAVVGLLAATTFRLGKANVKGWLPLAIALASFAVVVGFKANSALVVVASGLVGVLTLTSPTGPAIPKAGGA